MKKTWWFALTIILLSLLFETVLGGTLGLGFFLTLGVAGWAYIAFFLVIDGVIAWIRRLKTGKVDTGFFDRATGYFLWSIIFSLIGLSVVGLLWLLFR